MAPPRGFPTGGRASRHSRSGNSSGEMGQVKLLLLPSPAHSKVWYEYGKSTVRLAAQVPPTPHSE